MSSDRPDRRQVVAADIKPISSHIRDDRDGWPTKHEMVVPARKGAGEEHGEEERQIERAVQSKNVNDRGLGGVSSWKT
jgi:hypothetical protein